jgi:CheY-like chemotaxis protein
MFKRKFKIGSTNVPVFGALPLRSFIDGYEVLRRLREQPHASQPLVAAVTGFGQPEDRRHTQEAGFDHHLVKPFGPDALMALIQSLGPK